MVSYTFPPGRRHDELALHWYDGGNMPPAEVFEGTVVDPTSAKKFDLVMVGERGKLLFNRGSTRWIATPEGLVDDLGEVGQSLPRVANEDQEWIDAILGKAGPPLSGFEYSGPFTEAVLLGNVALRLGRGFAWDGGRLEATDAPEAAPLVRRKYRSGWEV